MKMPNTEFGQKGMLLEAFVEKNEPIMETGYKIPMSSGFYIVENIIVF